MTKKITIIIVSHNAAYLLSQCLDSIKRQNFQGEIFSFLIDTGKDETQFLIKDKYPWVEYFPYPENDGFGKANNLGIEKYFEKSDYFLILNPDTELKENNLQKMVEYLDKNEKVAVVSCKLTLPSGKLDRGCKRGFPTPWRSLSRFLYLDKVFPKTKIFGGYHLTYLDENEIHEVDSVKGAYMLVRKEAICDVGMFDEDYWMYGEDLDWCYRFKQKGWKIVYNPEALCLHYQGVCSGLKKESQHLTKASYETKVRTIRAFHEAMHIFYKKHYQSKYPKLLNIMVLSSVSVKMYFSLLKLRLKK